MEPLCFERGAKGGFWSGTLAQAVVHFEELHRLMAPVRTPVARCRALWRLAALARALELRFAGDLAPPPGPGEGLSAGVMAELREALFAGVRPESERGAARARLFASLEERLFAAAPLATGDLDRWESALRSLFEPGQGSAAAARRAAVLRAPAQRAVPSNRRAQVRAWLSQVCAALRLGRTGEAEALLADAPGSFARDRARLAIARHLAGSGDRTAARRALSAVESPLLATAVAVVRARLDLDGGLVQRAGRRADALPGALHLPSRSERALAERTGRFDLEGTGLFDSPCPAGEPEPERLACAREAMILRWKLGRIAPASRAARDALSIWMEDPETCAALFSTWDGEAGPAAVIAGAPGKQRPGLHDRWRSAFVRARADVLRAEAPELTGTLADLRRATAPDCAQPCWDGPLPSPAEPAIWEGRPRTARPGVGSERGPRAGARGDPLDGSLALALGALGAPAWKDAELRRAAASDAAAPARALFDEGFSLTARRERRRSVLIEAAKTSITKLFTPAEPPADAAPLPADVARQMALCRARQLLRLGGERAAAALFTALRSLLRGRRRPPAAIRLPLLDALVHLSPRKALELLVEAVPSLAAAMSELRALAERLEARGLLVRGTGSSLATAHDHLFLRFGACAAGWLGGFVTAFVEGLGAPPGPPALARLCGVARASLPEEPRELVAAWIAERDSIVNRPFRAFVRELDFEKLSALASVHPIPFGRRPPPWDDADWKLLLRRLHRDIPGRARAPLRELGRALGEHRPALARLLRGAPPTPLLDQDIPLDDRGRLVLRCLDKRRDAIAFLRFADSVVCCFMSDSCLYEDEGDCRDTQFMVLSLYRDPLSFCFQIRARSGPLAEPFGFVFGSFGVCERRPAVLLNGVYLRRQSRALRFAILGAIERCLCAPLGIRDVAVGASNGGHGPLPPGYEARPREVRRLRALSAGGGPARHVYDDISVVVNTEFETDGSVHWRTLPSPCAAS